MLYNESMNAAQIIASIIFGSIGFAAFVYGKKQSSLKALVIGILLMVYSYFVTQTIAVYAVGVILTVALFVLPGD